MANCCLGWPTWELPLGLYTPTVSGGSFSASLPASNVLDKRLGVVARSSDALEASTQIIFDLKAARAVGVLAIVGHNLSAAATVQWLGGTTSGGSEVYAGAATAVSFSAATLEDMVGINFPAIQIPATPQTARYWTMKVVDTANTDGYVQIGRVCVCGIYQPTVNMLVGATTRLSTATEGKDTDGGATIWNAKAIRRHHDFTLDDLNEADAQTKLWKMQRLLGKHGQLVWVFDTADTTYLHERSFLATLEELGGLEYPYVIARTRVPLRVQEVL